MVANDLLQCIHLVAGDSAYQAMSSLGVVQMDKVLEQPALDLPDWQDVRYVVIFCAWWSADGRSDGAASP